jgi:hypothetical protein
VTVASNATGRFWLASALLRAWTAERVVRVAGAAAQAAEANTKMIANAGIYLFIAENPI